MTLFLILNVNQAPPKKQASPAVKVSLPDLRAVPTKNSSDGSQSNQDDGTR